MNVNVKLVIFLLSWMTYLLVMENFNKNASFDFVEKFCHYSKNYVNERSQLKELDPRKSETIFDLSKHLTKFYSYVRIEKIDNLLIALTSTTDALIIVPLMTEIVSVGVNINSGLEGFLQQSTNKLFLKQSLQLSIPIFRGIITTEIVTNLLKVIIKPAMAKINMSPLKRKELYEKLFRKRYELIDEYLIHKYNETTALNILRNYVFIPFSVMTQFVVSLKNGQPLQYYNNKLRLINPNFYEKLRFNMYIENMLTKEQAIERIHDIYSQEEINSINIPIGESFNDYMANNLLDTITFDDYYAIKILLSNSRLYKEDPNFDRIMKAVYSLAIRQFDSISKTKINNILYCWSTHDWNGMIITNYLPNSTLLLCNEASTKWDYVVMNAKKTALNTSTTSETFYKVILKKLFLAVQLRNVVENSGMYLILPESHLKVINREIFFNGSRSVLLMELNDSNCRSGKWLTNVANTAFRYYEMCEWSNRFKSVPV